MANERILIVEDDQHISQLVKYNLQNAGYQCQTTITGEEALEILDQEEIDLIILDVMLPKMDGFETCKEIRQEKAWSSIPIMMLTARGEEIDKVLGFEIGVDDYMVKPFSPRELVLRVKAILRRGQTKESNKEILSAGHLTLDIPRHKVTVKGKKIDLTSMEFDLLAIFMQRQGRVQTRDQLLNDVWNLDADITTRTVDTHVKCLRQKLGKAGKLIETVRGYGYRFSEEDA